jgi:hypothetical protein
MQLRKVQRVLQLKMRLLVRVTKRVIVRGSRLRMLVFSKTGQGQPWIQDKVVLPPRQRPIRGLRVWRLTSLLMTASLRRHKTTHHPQSVQRLHHNRNFLIMRSLDRGLQNNRGCHSRHPSSARHSRDHHSVCQGSHRKLVTQWVGISQWEVW